MISYTHTGELTVIYNSSYEGSNTFWTPSTALTCIDTHRDTLKRSILKKIDAFIELLFINENSGVKYWGKNLNEVSEKWISNH